MALSGVVSMCLCFERKELGLKLVTTLSSKFV